MKLFVAPRFRGEDKADGGIRRVVEAQHKYLPEFGVEVVDNEAAADVVAVHAGVWVETDKPVVAHCHGMYWSEYEWASWHHDLNKHVLETIRRADVVTAPSEWVANVLRRGMWLDARVLYHGVDPDEWVPRPAPPARKYVLWNKTRVDPVCDPVPLTELAVRCPDVDFVTTFYEGPHAGNVQVTGPLGYEMGKRLIQDASIYMCITRETFGIGTLEAMACGVPVLGWSWGGQAEFIRHKETGWLCTPGDVEGLAEGMYWLLQNHERVAKAAREQVLREFTWKNAIARYPAVYQEALASRKHDVKVSVVIPCYNMEQWLPDAVQSVLTQEKPPDFEVVIVNDGSTDGSLAVAARLADSDNRIRVVHNPDNLYLAGALNRGIEQAKGEYIVPLDADNMLGPRALQVLAWALDDDRSMDIAYGAMEVIRDDGSRFVSGWPQEFDFRAQLAHRNQCPSTSMYRRKVWSRSGGYRRRCRTAEDADFWCRVTSLGFKPHKVTDAVTLVYRDRQDSMSHVEKDWDWTAWYSWSRETDLTPFGAYTHLPSEKLQVPTYEPVTVSVIIPVGPGHGKHVINAVDSVYSQTFLGWECIVVNDSGEDLGWLPPWVNVLDTDHSASGPSVARNLGILASKAPLFLPLDADDYLHPMALERLLEVWRQEGGYVYADWFVQDTGEKKQTQEYVCKNLLQGLPHPVTALYSKSAWREAGGFDEGMMVWEDWDFVIAINAKGYCGTRVATPLMYYNLHSGGRREKAAADRDLLKHVISDKWNDYIYGGKELMACAGCRGKPAPRVNQVIMEGGGGSNGSAGFAPAMPMASGSSGNNDLVLIEFIKPRTGKITYVGSVTNTSYKFGSDPPYNVRYVYKADAELLLGRSAEFRMFRGAEDVALVGTGA